MSKEKPLAARRRRMLWDLQDAIAYRAECEHEPSFLAAWNVSIEGNAVTFTTNDGEKWKVTLTRVHPPRTAKRSGHAAASPA